MKLDSLRLITLLIALVFFFPGRIESAPYYEGKRITIIVGFGTGGGYDRVARLLAKYLPKYVPGKPVFIIQNMPGASSIIAANTLFNLTKPDGLTIGTFDRGIPFAQLMKSEGVRFDITKYGWIGSASVETSVLALRTDLPFKTANDLLKSKSQIILGQSGPADFTAQFAMLLKEFLGLNFKFISYPSGADIHLAIERKELDGRAGSYSALKPLILRGIVQPLIRGRFSEPGIENLSMDQDLTSDRKGKTLMAMHSAPERVGRPYVAPPGTPDHILSILRDAFAKVAKDPELKEDSKKLMMPIDYVPADECLKTLNYVLSQPEDIVKDFSKYVKILKSNIAIIRSDDLET